MTRLILIILFLSISFVLNAQSVLSKLAYENYLNGKFEEAIRLETKALKIYGNTFGREHPDYASSLINLAGYYSAIDNDAEAIKLVTEALEIRKKILGTEHPDYASSLNDLALYNFYLGNNAETIKLGTKALEIRKKILGTEHPDYASSLNDLALYNFYLGNYAEAIKLGTEALEIRKKVLGTEHPDYASSLNSLALYNSKLGNYVEAIKLETEALEIRKKVLGTKHPNYAGSLNSLVDYYSELGNYAEAIKFETEVLEITKNVLGTEHPDYISSLNDLALYNFYLGNYAEAIKLGTEALEINKKVSGTEHPDYASSLHNLALYNSELGNYVEAIKLETEALEINKKVSGTEHLDYAGSLNSLALYNSYLGNYAEAIMLGTEALEINEKVLSAEHPDYVGSLNNLALYNSYLGNYAEAIKLGTEALEINKKVLGMEHPDYASSLHNLASYYSDLGNYAEAIKLGTEALEIRKKILGTEHPDYASSLINLSNYYSSIDNYAEAIRLVTEALEINKKVLGAEHPNYSSSLHNLALYNSYLGNYTEAIRLVTESLEITEKVLGREHPYYAQSLNILAVDYSNLGNCAEAIRLGTEALEINKKVLGTEHSYYANSLNKLANYYSDLGNQKKLLEIIRELFSIKVKNLTYNFKYLSKAERLHFWETQNTLFDLCFPLYTWKYPSRIMTTTLMNALLISKGILLNSEIEFDKLLSESGSSDLKNKYESIKLIRFQLNKLYEKPIAERHVDIDSLERHANELERQLMRESTEFGDYTRNLLISWEEVRDNLKDKDVAVEFVNFPLNTDSIMYMACVLKANTSAPVLVKLFEEKDLSTLSDVDLYKTVKGSELIWAKLQAELDGAENVYFAPDGILHQIGIEYFPDFEDSHKHIYDRYNLYRLSSTRQVALKKRDKSSGNAIIYGGIQYYADAQTMIDESRKYDVTSSRSIKPWYNLADTLSLRSGVEYLKFTLTEASLVSELLQKANKQHRLFTGNEATEESVRSLSGNKNGILHIATHGFYWEPDEAEYRAESNERLHFMSQSGDNARRNTEDKALTRTGLFMAGVNNALTGKDIPDGVDDGILTAQEIANLDFRGLDLVVLSACQTGMGDISGDGVFGLQRGFKKAGANTILMSLWDVNDEATQILMTEFYKNYLNGLSKREALLEAQKAVRETPGFEDPEYWAAFVLLDGLN